MECYRHRTSITFPKRGVGLRWATQITAAQGPRADEASDASMIPASVEQNDSFHYRGKPRLPWQTPFKHRAEVDGHNPINPPAWPLQVTPSFFLCASNGGQLQLQRQKVHCSSTVTPGWYSQTCSKCVFSYFVMEEGWPFCINHCYKELIPVFAFSISEANINWSQGRGAS